MKRIPLFAAFFIIVAMSLVLSHIVFEGAKAQSENDKSANAAQDSEAKSSPEGKRLFDFVGTESFADKQLSIAAVRQQEIEISFEAIDSLQAEQIEIPLFDGLKYLAVRRESEGFTKRSADSFSWRAKFTALAIWTETLFCQLIKARWLV